MSQLYPRVFHTGSPTTDTITDNNDKMTQYGIRHTINGVRLEIGGV